MGTGFVCDCWLLLDTRPDPSYCMSYNIFQLEIILLKVIRLFSLGDSGRRCGPLPLPAGPAFEHPGKGTEQVWKRGAGRVEGAAGRWRSCRRLAEQTSEKCTKMLANSFDFDFWRKVNGNIFVDFSVYFRQVFPQSRRWCSPPAPAPAPSLFNELFAAIENLLLTKLLMMHVVQVQRKAREFKNV